MNIWLIFIIAYSFLIFISFLPILRVIFFSSVKPVKDGFSFQDAINFSEDAKTRLEQNFIRINGTLGFWKREAEKYKRLHYYFLIWITIASVIVPVLSQTIDSNDIYSKTFLTLVSTHAAISMAFYRILKIENNYKIFRIGESEFYDLYRRIMDDPTIFGDDEETQLSKYFAEVEKIRQKMRNAEINNFPSIEKV